MNNHKTMPEIKNSLEVNNRVLRELIVEILREQEKRVSFPHWANWRNLKAPTAGDSLLDPKGTSDEGVD
jgi:hypothetical protein